MKKTIYILVGVIIVLSLAFLFIFFEFTSDTYENNTDSEFDLIEQTKEIINEKNYFAKDETQHILLGYNVRYDIYSDEKNYYVVLSDEGNIVFAFTKYGNNFYYTGYGEFNKSSKIRSGFFCIDDVYKPDYNINDNTRVTRYLNYETVLSSVISNYNYGNFYTAYLLNSFPWDKSNYLNGSEQINVMIIDKDKNVFVTYCYFSANGWNVGTPGFKFNQDEYPELVEKYKDTAVYSKSAIRTILNDIGKYKLEIQATDAFSTEAYIVPVNAANDEYTIDCTITNLTSDELSVNLSENFFLCYSSNMTNPTAYGDIEELTFKPNEKKQISFNVDSVLLGEKDDKVIYGSCVLEITNSDKYDYFNVLKAEPYIIERNNNEKNN